MLISLHVTLHVYWVYKPDDNVVRTANRLWTLGCLATKGIVLLNWKERKPACFTRDSWLDLLNMEHASLLGDFEARQEDYGSLSAALQGRPPLQADHADCVGPHLAEGASTEPKMQCVIGRN